MNIDDKKSANQSRVFHLPSYTHAEEMMNAITHGLGIIFAVAAIIMLLAKYPHNFENMFSIIVYGTTLFILYAVSTLYHSLKTGKAKAVFRKLDHCSIFLLIAGTYTPLCTLCIKEPIALVVLACVWITAIVGIILNSIDVNKFSKFSLACYIIMGWSVVFIAKPVMQDLTQRQLNLLLLGGIFYTVGAALYVVGKKKRYIHSVWHIFVLAGSVCHFMILY
jgi:hemolysin III